MDETPNTMTPPPSTEPAPICGAEFTSKPENFLQPVGGAVRREEHDLTRVIDEAKGWSEKEVAMFVELLERRLQAMEAAIRSLAEG